MTEFSLFCKSYKNDVLRLVRLAKSILAFNTDSVPFYVSVPELDRKLFSERLAGLNVILITDESILKANPSLDLDKIAALPGGLSQQIVKSEFWRLNHSKIYLCLDSDCEFLRPFSCSDFIASDGIPYFVMHEAKEMLQFSVCHNQQEIYEGFHELRKKLAGIFQREGRHYDFGPVPAIWDSKVWRDLDDKFLQPRNMNIYDAILLLPSELLWYGEAVLRFRPYPILPVEPIFRVYHNESQYFFAKKNGEDNSSIAKNYLGICYQSNWQKELDFHRKHLLSRMARSARRILKNWLIA
jgi:hypothetical protein